jgi:hypothetical protein
MKEKKYIYLGIVFLLVQTLAIIRNITSDYFSFFWYCDFAPGVFAILFFLKKDQAIKGFLNIGLFLQTGYALALIYKLTFGTSPFGITIDILGPFQTITTLILHLSTITILLTTYKIKPKKTSLLYSLIFLILIYSIILIFTTPGITTPVNYNYVYYSKILTPHIPNYTKLWIPLAFLLIVLPTHFLQLLIYNSTKKKQNVTKKR